MSLSTEDLVTGIPDGSLQNEFRIYPNPANSNLTITTDPSLKNGTIRILSLTGAVLFEMKNISENTTLSVESLANGIYLVEFINHNGTFTKKLEILR